jgi:hypothetical protein
VPQPNRVPPQFVHTVWRPGQSGNPAGRPVTVSTLSRYVHQETARGIEIVNLFLAVMRGELITFGRARRRPTMGERLLAAQWLADRGWGKAREMVSIEDETMAPDERRAVLHAMTDDERAMMAALLARARARIDATPVPVVDEPVSPEDATPVVDSQFPEADGAPPA